MSESCVFIRAINDVNKGDAIRKRINSIKSGRIEANIFLSNPEKFQKIPGTPFAYWSSDNILNKFLDFKLFENDNRIVRVGDHPGSSERYLRLFWEIIIQSKKHEWIPYQKGGAYSPFFQDFHLLVDWDRKRQTYRNFFGRIGRQNIHPSNYQQFFRPGLTYSRSTVKGLSVRILNKNCIFADKGPCIFIKNDDEKKLFILLGLMNSTIFEFFAYLQHGRRAWEVGVIQKNPVPTLTSPEELEIGNLALEAYLVKRDIASLIENTHFFIRPILLDPILDTLEKSFKLSHEYQSRKMAHIEKIQNKIDEICFNVYSISIKDKNFIIGLKQETELTSPDNIVDFDESQEETIELSDRIRDLISYFVGCIFGRWDIRYANGERQSPPLKDPFDPLPACSPGMLQGDDGLPLIKSPPGYPLNVLWNGILVEDPGHSDDIVQKVREVFCIIYSERAEAIESEACSIIGVSHLGEYFKRISAKGFFDDHIKKYSKSRRKAPLYWKLSSNKSNYSVWLYYHRINRDTLFIVLNEYVNPKIELEETNYQELKQRKEIEKDTLSRNQLTKLGKEIEAKADFINELKDFKEKIEKIAKRGYDPDFDDGVILNMAPLHEIVPWKEPKAYWEDLEKGKYDWAHIAMKYWPDRVKEKCKKDKSLAIAHGMEHLYEAD